MRPTALKANGFCFKMLSAGPEDGELVLLLHGFPQFADAWSGILPSLAAAGFRAIAPDQRGYSPLARPTQVQDYDVANLTADVLALADTLGATSFHLAGHDWGGFLAWKLAAERPDQIRSLSVLSTPHVDAFGEALATDPDQQSRSRYIEFFKMPNHLAESVFLGHDANRLRGVYQGKVPEAQVSVNVRRLSEPAALTSVLNWYRALDLSARIGKIKIPTLYIWGDQDLALGRTAATETARYIDAPYRFEVLNGHSHWLLQEAPNKISELILNHLDTFGKKPQRAPA